MRSRSFLEYRNFLYLKLSLLLMIAAIVAYIFHSPAIGAYGGTWLGYVLGTLSAAIVGLLLWLGVRKRSYFGAGTMQGWLSAHVYLGLSLIVLATLHTSFQFGWNVHTLAYVLMMAVILSGFYGLYAYFRFPHLLTENLSEDSFESLLQEIGKLDKLARVSAMQLPDEIITLTNNAIYNTRIGGTVMEQIQSQHPDCPTTLAVKRLHGLSKSLPMAQIARARRDIMLRARLSGWLFIHVPLSIALLATLIAHVTAIFFYW
jgi:hypothetical protein